MQKIAIITGGGTGLGQSIAKQLADQHITVYIIGRRAHKLHETQAFSPENIIPITADVSLPEERLKIKEHLTNIKIDYLIHNAAIAFPIMPFEEISLDDFRQIQAINTEAPLFLTQLLLPQLDKQARILHISSDCARYPLANWIPYCTSKSALFMIYQCLKKEFQHKDIYIGSVDPGMMDTPMQQAILEENVLFPEKISLAELKDQNLIFSPDYSAKYCLNLLLNTTPDEFQAREYAVN